MHIVLWVLGALVALIPLAYVVVLVDYTVSRWFMEPSRAEFSLEQLSEGDDDRVLIVFLPGVLMRCIRQTILKRMLRGAMRNNASDILWVDYAGERFDARTITAMTYNKVKEIEADYRLVVFIGASLGGRMLNLIYHDIVGNTALSNKVARPIMLDSPMNHRQFAGGGDILAPVLRFVPIGRLVNMLRLTDRMAQPPQDKNIGNAADFAAFTNGEATTYSKYIAWVKACAMDGLLGHKFSAFRDMLVAMRGMAWYDDAFASHPPLYIANADAPCSWRTFEESVLEEVVDRDGHRPVKHPHNDTVKQFEGVAAFQDRVPSMKVSGSVWVVRSTHCGFAERPVAWNNALKEAINVVVR